MSMILAETYITCATKKKKKKKKKAITLGEAQGSLCRRPSFQAEFSGIYIPARNQCAVLPRSYIHICTPTICITHFMPFQSRRRIFGLSSPSIASCHRCV
jgi:hypothetical protein